MERGVHLLEPQEKPTPFVQHTAPWEFPPASVSLPCTWVPEHPPPMGNPLNDMDSFIILD